MVKPHVIRQIIVISDLLLCSMCEGLIFGQMSGMVADLQSKTSTIVLTENQISWIVSVINLSCVCGFAVATVISELLGRKRAITLLVSPLIVNWIMLYYAQSFIVLLLSRILVGVSFGAIVQLTILLTAEYTTPEVRGLCLSLVTSVGPAVGMTLGHISTIVFHWRTAALLAIIPTTLAALLPLFWVESPSWLAMKGKFEECVKSYKALHGDDGDRKELRLLIEVEKYKRSKTKESSNMFKPFFAAMKHRYFWKISSIGFTMNLYKTASGKLLLNTLAVTMLQEITGRSDILMFTLLLDGFVVLGSCLSCYLIRIMKMRTLLFSSGSLANVFLVALSAGLYFKKENDFYFAWINCALMAMYFIFVYAGSFPVIDAMSGEILPLEIKGACFVTFGTAFIPMFFLPILLAMKMFAAMGYHGVFLLNAVILTLCLLYLWVFLPETKGKTLQEIELYFKNGSFEKVDDLLNGEKTTLIV